MRVELNDVPPDDWEHFLRARDLRQVLASTSESLRGPVLEIGCGDGYITTLLRRHFDEVVPIDISPRDHVKGLCRANVEMLPFRDGQFGLVYSSNVLEHVENLTACLQELRRVMQDGGMMIHTMPTPAWKALQLALYPLHILFHVALPRLMGASTKTDRVQGVQATHSPEASDSAARRRGRRGRLHSILLPLVHGSAPSHGEELKRFRVAWWIGRFSTGGFHVIRTAPMYLHSAYRFFPYRLLAVREVASRAGLSSVQAYWLRKGS